jgi:hypothetical protein
MSRARFSRHNQPVKCRGCGKTTTEVVRGCIGLDLCAKCQKEAEAENMHSDESHEGSVEECASCQEYIRSAS